MSRLLDLTGQRFGRLTVIERAEDRIQPSGHRVKMWVCRCDCGKETVVGAYRLTSGHSKSCGCYNRQITGDRSRTHGKRHTRLYGIWLGMKNRCCNSKSPHYRRYGARGISVCDEWQNSFESFYQWAMANGYDDDLSIDRIDNDGPYTPENCRWQTMKAQCRNRRSNRLFEIDGEQKTLTEWCEVYQIDQSRVRGRLGLGWPIKKALEIE